MERLALNDLVKWKNSKNRMPLMVYGARQVGKSYLIKQLFAERYYKGNYIYVDLKIDTAVKDYIFHGSGTGYAIVDAKSIISFLELKSAKKITKDTLLIFDEAQECLPIITALKYFKQDFPEIPVIVSGSMVRIKIKRQQNINKQKNQESFFFPVGAISRLTIHPLSFDEFLMNYNRVLLEKIVEGYQAKKALDHGLHEMAMDALYTYLLVGGMPEALKIFLEEHDLLAARGKVEDIFSDYLSDMELYQASSESIIRTKAIFEIIYTELNKESKNFKSSFVAKGLKTRDIRSPKDWLTLANIVYESKQIKEHVSYPLVEDNENAFRLYLLDNGLFSFQSKIKMTDFIDKSARNTLSGLLFENYVATELVAKGIPLYYWVGKGSGEFEFMVEIDNETVPIDVKKSKRVLTSLNKYKSSNKCSLAIKLSANNYGYDEAHQILTIPLYQAFLLINDIKNEAIKLH